MRSLGNRIASLILVAWIGAWTAQAQIRPTATKNVDEPGRIPYQVYMASARGELNCGGNFCGFRGTAVPANKRLVITNIAITINLAATATAQAVLFRITDAASANYGQFYLPYNPNAYPTDPISSDSPRRYVLNEKVQVYVEAGQLPHITFHTSGGDLAPGWWNTVLLTGYLVDLSQ